MSSPEKARKSSHLLRVFCPYLELVHANPDSSNPGDICTPAFHDRAGRDRLVTMLLAANFSFGRFKRRTCNVVQLPKC